MFCSVHNPTWNYEFPVSFEWPLMNKLSKKSSFLPCEPIILLLTIILLNKSWHFTLYSMLFIIYESMNGENSANTPVLPIVLYKAIKKRCFKRPIIFLRQHLLILVMGTNSTAHHTCLVYMLSTYNIKLHI